MFAAALRLKKTIGESYNVDLDDTLRTKTALRRLGYYEPPKSHGQSIGMTKIPDNQMFDGLKRFQKDQGLVKDGVMKPGGPTATRLGQAIVPLDKEMQKRQTPFRSNDNTKIVSTPPHRAPAKPDPLEVLKELIARVPKKSLLSEDALKKLSAEQETDPTPSPHPPAVNDPGKFPRKLKPPANDDDDKTESEEPDEPDQDEDDDEDKKFCGQLNAAIKIRLIEINELKLEHQQRVEEAKNVREQIIALHEDLGLAKGNQAVQEFTDAIFSFRKVLKRPASPSSSRAPGQYDRNAPDAGPPSGGDVAYLEKALNEKIAALDAIQRKIAETDRSIASVEGHIRHLDQAKARYGCP